MIRSAMSRGMGIEISNVAANTLNVGQSRESPNDRRYRGFGTGQGNSLVVPHERSHLVGGQVEPAHAIANQSSSVAGLLKPIADVTSRIGLILYDETMHPMQ